MASKDRDDSWRQKKRLRSVQWGKKSGSQAFSFPWQIKLTKIVKPFLTDASHDWGHTERVLKTAQRIAKKEKADLEIVTAAVLLHDIGYAEDWEGHHALSAEKAPLLLKKVGFPKEKIPAVCHAILAHRFSRPPAPASLEAKILQDADKLDALGAIGIARCFMWTGEHREKLRVGVEHFHEKLLKLRGQMHTKTGRKIAARRHSYMLKFLETLEKE